MVMILIHHILCHVIFGVDSLLCHVGRVNFTMAVAIVINNFCYIGVNGFILISGYYGIKFKVRALLNLYLICAFYSLIMHLIDIYILGTKELCLGTMKDIILVFSQQDYWWFISYYVILYLLAPLLNKALNAFDRREYRFILLLLCIINLYFGYWWNRYGNNGYSVAQFIFLYVIGRYIGRFLEKDTIDACKKKWFLGYVIIMLFFSLLSILSHYIHIPHWISISYNNPLLLIGAIFFLLFMLSFHFQNKLINYVAASSLSIYLLQNFVLMKCVTIYVSRQLGVNFTLCEGGYVIAIMLIYLICFAFVFTIASVLFDQIRILTVSPIMSLYDIVNKRVQIKRTSE